MILTAQQNQKIKDYIFDATKYKETYHEVYDHILNALTDLDEVYSIELVTKIVNDDLGGLKEIKKQEELYQKQVNKRYTGLFRLEIVNTFKWPGILNNLTILALCICFYYTGKSAPFNMQPMTVATFACFMMVSIYIFTKIMMNKTKNRKYSIMDNSLRNLAFTGFFIGNFALLFFTIGNLIDLNRDTMLIAMLLLYFFSSVYIRAFIKFYNQQIKILIA
ncbi:hypothetical protein [Pedobacter cryoconitis]|uniref:Uncharacterized protein n=1 Tax=Pedobacter cryoconitis TaxID=188932 RepID=A0A7X0J7N2_9SPHI|nr:hypothetical protein [Pedobacter cryoconitis]MBB6502588.1 hypothetical protein [Pedobacter cryoconitis]